ncbi:MAG: glycosyltransferase [Microbacteriaceae bacterium]
MQPRVTVILVARNGAEYLEATLAALAQQTRRPDSFVVVDAGSSDDSAAILAGAEAAQFVASARRPTFGGGIEAALAASPPAESDDDWLWLLSHDNAPEPRALSALLGAVEIAPSVAVAGPKLMRWDQIDTIRSYGETVTRSGASVELVVNELDQAQHDRRSDLMAVAAAGMLVRRRVWTALGGFDPGLPHIDAALDFCIRVRLAGHRIVGVPTARVATTGAPDLFGARRDVTASAVARHSRAAQLHRRLTYAPPLAVPLHWLSLVPLALGRSVAHLLAKNPAAITGELSAAFTTAFVPGVVGSRSRLRRSRSLGWGAIAPLRMPWPEVRELRANRREARAVSANPEPLTPRPGFLSGGGAWITLALAAVSVVVFGSFLNATALTGGGLLPLSSTIGQLWENVTYGWHEVGGGFTGAADPFAWVLAVLGSFTFWSPSLSIVALYVVSLPLAGLGAWWCAARLSQRAWAPVVAAIVWALAPPFLASVAGGHLGAVIAHLLLPWFIFALFGSARSWSAAGAAALLFAGVAASAPVLVPALLLTLVAWMATHPRRSARLLAIPIPALVLFLPLIAQQGARGNWLGLLADPGVIRVTDGALGWQLALGAPVNGLSGWAAVLDQWGLPALTAPALVALLLLPLAGLAVLALFLRGSRRAIAAMGVALIGFVTAVIAVHVQIAFVGSASASIWAGSAVSFYWLGLTGAAVITLDSLARAGRGRAVVAPAIVAIVAAVALAAPLLLAPPQGSIDVVASSGRILPALVTAEAATAPRLGTLELVAQRDGSLAAILHRGAGATLDEQSTLAVTLPRLTRTQERIAVLAANVASRSGFDTASEFTDLGIGFVLAPDPVSAAGDARSVRARTGEALDANPLFTAVGSTANGYLWRFDGETDAVALAPEAPSYSAAVLLAQAIVLAMALLLAIPTSVRRRAPVTTDDEDLTTDSEFDEDDNV